MADVSGVYAGSEYKEALKIMQEGTIQEMLELEEPFYKLLKKNLKVASQLAKRIEFGTKVELGESAVGAIAYGGDFPLAQKAVYKNIAIEPKYLAGHVEVDNAEYQLAKRNGVAAYTDLLKDEVESKNMAMAKDMSRQCMSDGSAVIGTVASSTDLGTTGSIVLDVSATAQGSVYWMNYGDILEILDATDSYAAHDDLGASGGRYAKVLDIDHDANTITVQALLVTTFVADGWQPSTALAAGDLLVRLNKTYNDSPTTVDVASEEMIGFDGIVSNATTTLFGVDRSAVPQFKGRVRDCDGELLSVKDLHKIAKQIKTFGGKPDNILVSFDSYERLCEIGESRISTISSPTWDANLGIETIHYASPSGGQVPIENTRYCPTTRVFMIESKEFELRGYEPEFVEAGDSGDVFRLKVGSSAYSNTVTAELFGMMAMFSKRPARSGKLINFINEE